MSNSKKRALAIIVVTLLLVAVFAILIAVLITFARAPQEVANFRVDPSQITLSLDDCREITKIIPDDEAVIEQTVKNATRTAKLGYSTDLIIDNSEPVTVDNVSQIVEECYTALHGAR